MNKEQLVAEIMYLGALVNANTELCVFVRYSGHVDVLNMDIAESKENYSSKILEVDSRLYTEKGMESAEKTKEELINILLDHKIPYESPFLSLEGVKKEAVSDASTKQSGLEDRVIDLETEMADMRVLLSELLEERGACRVPEELPRSRGDRQADEYGVGDRLQEAH